MSNIPNGLCQCGCGGQAPIVTTSHAKRGRTKGNPSLFIHGHNMKLKPRTPVRFRLLLHVDIRGPKDCWIWKNAANKNYNYITDEGHGVPAHRIMYEMVHGKIAEGMDICHTCDNPPCCNPMHLFQGTESDNMRDAIAKGRK